MSWLMRSPPMESGDLDGRLRIVAVEHGEEGLVALVPHAKLRAHAEVLARGLEHLGGRERDLGGAVGVFRVGGARLGARARSILTSSSSRYVSGRTATSRRARTVCHCHAPRPRRAGDARRCVLWSSLHAGSAPPPRRASPAVPRPTLPAKKLRVDAQRCVEARTGARAFISTVTRPPEDTRARLGLLPGAPRVGFESMSACRVLCSTKRGTEIHSSKIISQS